MTEHHDKAPDEVAADTSIEVYLARGALVLLVCTAIYLLLGLGIYRFWQPSPAIYYELFASTVIDSWLIQPEPHEQRLFMLVIFTIPFLILLLWRWLCAGKFARLIDRYANAIIVVAAGLIVAIAIAGLVAKNPLPQPQPSLGTGAGTFAVVSNVNAGFYFFGTFVYEHFYLYSLVFFPLCFWLLTNRGVHRFLHEQERRVNVAILLAAAVLAAWMLPAATFRFPYTEENRYDFNAVYYPMVQVYHGAQLLADRLTDTYGLYPQFLLPFFRLTGLSVATFSGTMAILTVACFGLLLLILWRLIDNRLILFWTFAAVIFYGYCYSRTVNPFDPYFAMIPLRLVTSMTALGLSFWCRRGTGRLATVIALALLAAGVLWTPDFGLVSYLGFTLYLGYLRVDLAQPRRTVIALSEILAISLITLAGVFAGYALGMYFVYGTSPDLRLLFGSMKTFSVLGMLMLPMPLFHPWNLVALTFAGGLLATLPALLRGAQDERSATLFLITLLGTGTFTYYQGRSHNWNLLPVLLFTIPLWGICADRLLRHVGRNRWLYAPLALLVFVLGTALPQLVYAARPLMSLVEERENRDANQNVQLQIERGAEFIRSRTTPGEKVQIFTNPAWQGLYHGLAQRGAAFNPSYMDLFWREDYERLVVFLRDNATEKVFYEKNTISPLSQNLAAPVSMLLECCYDAVDTSGAMLELVKSNEAKCRRCLENNGFDQVLQQATGGR